MERSDHLVLEVLEGCAEIARRDATALGPVRIVSPTELHLCTDDLDAVRALRTVVAASVRVAAPGRRPRVLLETSVQQRVGEAWSQIRRQRPRQVFTGLRLQAAGAESAEMTRLAQALGELLSLPVDPAGDLAVRVRRTADGEGWELLLRTTSRPLSTRSWRAVDYPGAVNGTIAAGVLALLDVTAEDSLLDMTCGSGTFLIEQLYRAVPERTVGIDVSEEAIAACREHQRAARQRGRIEWIHGDVLTTPLEGGFTRLVTNPPWGMLHGDHATNEALHTALLERASQLAAPGARLAVLTQEVRRMRAVLARPEVPWQVTAEHRFFQKGHRPCLFLLEQR